MIIIRVGCSIGSFIRRPNPNNPEYRDNGMLTQDKEFLSWAAEIRRKLHIYPETAFQEKNTTAVIASWLTEMGVEIQTFNEVTGLSALISGAQDGPTVGLRADIDALPIMELNNVAYKSRINGNMHACGHDANTAIMLGVAKKIIDTGLQRRMHGNVKLLFQPAEEIGMGAKVLIDQGVLEDPHVDIILAGHMTPDFKAGQVGIHKELGYASSDHFQLKLTGKGGHGARPEDCIDPIVAGAYFVNQIQSIIGRNIKPTDAAVITVGRFESGTAGNVIPESAFLEGSIRALSEPIRVQAISRLREMANGLTATFGVQVQFEVVKRIPLLKNDPEISNALYQAAQSVVGDGNVTYIPPHMGSDDFSFFSMLRPAAIIRLGCANQEKGIVHSLHSPRFDIDESVLGIGVELFYNAVCRFLVQERGSKGAVT